MALFPNVVDVEAATRRGLPVTVVPHVITKTTCDLTCALVIGLAWRLVEADRFVRDGRFHQEQSTTFLTQELSGKLVGMIGLGEIGTEIVTPSAGLRDGRDLHEAEPAARGPGAGARA